MNITMDRIIAACLCPALALVALTLALPAHCSQATPAKPTKRSFSNPARDADAKSALPANRQATQEELTDAVLGDTMRELWEQADVHGHQGEYNHVINLCRIVGQGDPHNVEAFATPAYLFWSTGRNDDAEAILRDGIDANPSTYYMYNEMGRYWQLERKDYKAAVPYYEKAVKFDCPFTTWNSLANCYERTGQLEKAIAAWEKATLFPDDPVAIVRLKSARAKLARQKRGQ